MIVWVALTLLLARSVVAVLERAGVASEQHRRRWFWSVAAGLGGGVRGGLGPGLIQIGCGPRLGWVCDANLGL